MVITIAARINSLSKHESELEYCSRWQQWPQCFTISHQEAEYVSYPLDFSWSCSFDQQNAQKWQYTNPEPRSQEAFSSHSQTLEIQCPPWEQTQASLTEAESPCKKRPWSSQPSQMCPS